ncbi:MAG: hypothetical protein M3362_25800, partial [Acidobacteriota bacterium]|nr:hypothetical protein [Acidobacteriota bacterium]
MPGEDEVDGDDVGEDEFEADIFEPVFPLVLFCLLQPTNERININASPKTGRGEYTLFITYLPNSWINKA